MTSLFPAATTYEYQVHFDENGTYQNDTFLSEGTFEHDIYSFEINTGLNVQMFLTPSGGDADLELYQDSNYNGQLDVDDLLIDGSYGVGTNIDSIDSYLQSGSYFAVVDFYSSENGGDLDYTFEMTVAEDSTDVDPLFPEATSYHYDVSFNNGSYHNDTFLSEGSYEYDIYSFEINTAQNVDMFLTPSGGDADLKLYQDSNYNNRLDVNDLLLDGSYNAGTSSDSIDSYLQSGSYFAVVDFYSAYEGGSLDYSFSIAADAM